MDEEGSVEASVIHEKSTALSTEFKEFAEDDDEDHDDLLELAWHCWVSGEKHMNTALRHRHVINHYSQPFAFRIFFAVLSLIWCVFVV